MTALAIEMATTLKRLTQTALLGPLLAIPSPDKEDANKSKSLRRWQSHPPYNWKREDHNDQVGNCVRDGSRIEVHDELDAVFLSKAFGAQRRPDSLYRRTLEDTREPKAQEPCYNDSDVDICNSA